MKTELELKGKLEVLFSKKIDKNIVLSSKVNKISNRIQEKITNLNEKITNKIITNSYCQTACKEVEKLISHLGDVTTEISTRKNAADSNFFMLSHLEYVVDSLKEKAWNLLESLEIFIRKNKGRKKL